MPPQELLELVINDRQEKVDALVASKGYQPGRIFICNTAEKILSEMNCSVLTVKPESIVINITVYLREDVIHIKVVTITITVTALLVRLPRFDLELGFRKLKQRRASDRQGEAASAVYGSHDISPSLDKNAGSSTGRRI